MQRRTANFLRFVPLATAFGAIFLSSARAAPIGQWGLAIKTGEAAGSWGAQVAWNRDAHWQVSAGVGGVNIPFFIDNTVARTDSYFLMPKYYFKHMYLGAGYSLKRARIDKVVDNVPISVRADAHGIPMTLGYEFGRRKGFYFATSICWLQNLKGGGRRLEILNAARTDATSIETASSGPSIGMTLGYYFDFDP